MSKKAKIAIPAILQDASNYVYAMHFLGAEPVIVTPVDKTGELGYLPAAEFRIRDFDGLLLPGGSDINPILYHQENTGSIGIHDDLDTLQFLILDSFISHRKPVLGICRGHQMLNVYFGGSLFQDIATTACHSREAPAFSHPDKIHCCLNRKGSWTETLYGSKCRVNSAHHQAICLAGEGLVIDSVCEEDKIMEAMHHESLPVWSVQYHPERMCFSHFKEGVADGSLVLKYFLDYIRES